MKHFCGNIVIRTDSIMPVQVKYLFGKYIDSTLAIFIGTVSFFIFEKKVDRPQNERLLHLIKNRLSGPKTSEKEQVSN